MSEIDIRAVVKKARDGDSDAITTLYQTYSQAIYRYISYRVATSADAEDLTAEVFIKMVEALPGYKLTGAPFESWLYRIAAARVADYHRKTQRRPQSELTEDLTSNAPSVEDQIDEREQLEMLRDALAHLTEEQQTVLVLRFIERKSHSDVAEIIGKSVSAVKSIQHRALVQLTGLVGSDEKTRHYLRGIHD